MLALAPLTLDRARYLAVTQSGLVARLCPRRRQQRLVLTEHASTTPSEDFRIAKAPGPTLTAVASRLPNDVLARLCHTTDQERALRRFLACRTPTLGGTLELCACCEHFHTVYRSCGDRHCPQCQALASERWVSKTMARTLAVRYFHVVLTLPKELHGLVYRNQRALYGLLFSAGKAAVLGAAKARLTAQLGATAVLHTWNSRGEYHPHLHAIVTAGGLNEDGEWLEPDESESMLPLDTLRAEFRERFLAGVEALHERGELKLSAGLSASAALEDRLDRAKKRLWHVYTKRTLEGAEGAFRYLARYTTRVGITNTRIVSFDPVSLCVRYETKHGETLELSAKELIRRFLLHVLPARFHRIRHWGLFAPRNGKTKLPMAREALAQRRANTTPEPTPKAPAEDPESAPPKKSESLRELVLRLTGVDLSRCPRCDGALTSHELRPHDDPRRLAATIRGLARTRGPP